MDRRSTENMKLDRRLIGRRGWISDKDLQGALDGLPDVSDKAASGDQDSEPSPETAAVDSAPPPETSAAAVTPPAPDTGFTAAVGSEPGDVGGPSGPPGSDLPPA